ncbi:hypothetical protein CGRA01v4_12982 [Colletotrichum graminicola]|nr:hypothetical protein CGRA01v4_12982 [Colletotrichum graminicola]
MIECCPLVELHGTALFPGVIRRPVELSSSIIGRIGFTPQTPRGSVILSFGPISMQGAVSSLRATQHVAYYELRTCSCSLDQSKELSLDISVQPLVLDSCDTLPKTSNCGVVATQLFELTLIGCLL